MATLAPSLAKATATARPMPESPPVISARRPSSRPRPVYPCISSAGCGLISPAVPGYGCCCAGGGLSADGADWPGCVVMVMLRSVIQQGQRWEPRPFKWPGHAASAGPFLPAAARRRCRAAAGLALARYPQRPPANRACAWRPGGSAVRSTRRDHRRCGRCLPRERCPWPRLVQNRIRIAAVPPAEGNAMVGEFFPEVGQGPVPQLDPVAGAQRLLADGLPVYPAGGPPPRLM